MSTGRENKIKTTDFKNNIRSCFEENFLFFCNIFKKVCGRVASVGQKIKNIVFAGAAVLKKIKIFCLVGGGSLPSLAGI